MVPSPLRTLVVLCALVPSPGWGQPAGGPPELAALLKSYEAERARVLAPVDRKFAIELERLQTQLTKSGRLDDALAVREVLAKMKSRTGGVAPDTDRGGRNPFLGEWAYRENDRNYRRIILPEGRIEIWRDGREWMLSGRPIWEGFSWTMDGRTLRILDRDKKEVCTWKLRGEDTVIETVPGRERETERVRAGDAWRAGGKAEPPAAKPVPAE